MNESIPSAIEFSHFTMGMGLINSRTKDRMSRKLFDQLKHNPVYGFLVKNLNFKTALDSFCLRPYIQQSEIKDELHDEVLYHDYVSMSLMNVLAKSAAEYLNEDFNPEYRAIVVNSSERARYANVLKETLELANSRLFDLPEADYMQFERIGKTFLHAINDDKFLAYPQTLKGINLIAEKRFVCGLYRSIHAAYNDSQPNIVINLAQIILDEVSEHTAIKWLNNEKKLCHTKDKINLAAQRANEESDKYFR
jgi:hypothetical protein